MSVLWPSKYAIICFRPGLCFGPRWGSSRRSPRPFSRLERGHPFPYPTSLGTDPPSALAMRPPEVQPDLRLWPYHAHHGKHCLVPCGQNKTAIGNIISLHHCIESNNGSASLISVALGPTENEYSKERKFRGSTGTSASGSELARERQASDCSVAYATSHPASNQTCADCPTSLFDWSCLYSSSHRHSQRDEAHLWWGSARRQQFAAAFVSHHRRWLTSNISRQLIRLAPVEEPYRTVDASVDFIPASSLMHRRSAIRRYCVLWVRDSVYNIRSIDESHTLVDWLVEPWGNGCYDVSWWREFFRCHKQQQYQATDTCWSRRRNTCLWLQSDVNYRHWQVKYTLDYIRAI